MALDFAGILSLIDLFYDSFLRSQVLGKTYVTCNIPKLSFQESAFKTDGLLHGKRSMMGPKQNHIVLLQDIRRKYSKTSALVLDPCLYTGITAILAFSRIGTANL